MDELIFEKQLTLPNGKKIDVFDGTVENGEIKFSDLVEIRKTYISVDNPVVKLSYSVEVPTIAEMRRTHGIDLLLETQMAILQELEAQIHFKDLENEKIDETLVWNQKTLSNEFIFVGDEFSNLVDLIIEKIKAINAFEIEVSPTALACIEASTTRRYKSIETGLEQCPKLIGKLGRANLLVNHYWGDASPIRIRSKSKIIGIILEQLSFI